MSFVALFSFFSPFFFGFSFCFIRLIQVNSLKSSKRNTLQENEKKTPNTLSIFTIMKIDGKANAFISSIFLSCLDVSSALFCRSFSHTFSASKLMTHFQPIYSQFYFITLTPPFWQNERPIKKFRLPICLSTLSHTYKVLSSIFMGTTCVLVINSIDRNNVKIKWCCKSHSNLG